MLAELQQVSKMYGKTRALDSVSLGVRPGSVHALLGHNGAGKTTSIRLLVGLLRPDSGQVRVLGVDPYRSPSVRRHIGYVGENEGLYRGLSVAVNLSRFCLSKLADIETCRREVARLAETFELDGLLDKKVGELSSGNRQRVVLARAFLGSPRVVILDEPFNKLDPVWRARLRGFLRNYAEKNGAGVLFSTHVLSDVEEVADFITILRRGMVVFQGSLGSLQSSDKRIEVRIASRDRAGLEVLARAFADRVERVADGFLVMNLNDPGEVHDLLGLIAEKRIPLDSLEVRRLSLERLYLYYYEGGGDGDAGN